MIGRTLSHFRILAKIGEGGMGVVYCAEDTKLRRQVALKVLPPDLVSNEERRLRFLREARAAAAVTHPNIATIHEVDEADGVVFIAMELVEGKTLRDHIGGRPMAIKDALRIATEMAEGLAEAHKAGVIHRDLKPDNVIVRSNGHAKILDFGLAKLLEAHAEAGSEELSKLQTISGELTREGKIFGTAAYMSPEQAEGKPVDARSDVFSFGTMLYEMLTGQRPFKGKSRTSMLIAIVRDPPPALMLVCSELPQELERIVLRCLEKKPEARYPSANELWKSLAVCQSKLAASGVGLGSILRRPRFAITGLVLLVAAALVGSWLFVKNSRARWALQDAIPRIEELQMQSAWLAEGTKIWEAFDLATEVEAVLGDDPALIRVWETTTREIDITSEPPAASVWAKAYAAPEAEWRYIGRTPLHQLRFPLGTSRIKVELAGHSTAYDLLLNDSFLFGAEWSFPLQPEGTVPKEMVFVPGGEYELFLPGLEHLKPEPLSDFLINRYEVTNRDYKIFIDAGGYEDRKYWKHPFIDGSRTLSWEEAIERFTGRAGRPGPAAWEVGDYPDGEDDYPVSGVSWFEAAAYAEFAGKRLPTIFHWNHVACTVASGEIIPLSNIGSHGSAAVGSHAGMHRYGVFDLAGNVREWSYNPASGEDQRFILGGGWSDPDYAFADAMAQSPWNRSNINGFRCMRTLDEEETHSKLTRAIDLPFRDFYKETPVSDEVFSIFRKQYYYDRTPLEPRVEEEESYDGWTREKITYNAAYGGERMIAYLFLPHRSSPPYQTVIIFPGSDAIQARSSSGDKGDWAAYLLNSGRAMISPIYKSTYERGDELNSDAPNESNFWKEHVIMWGKDLARTIDYLETRNDIDVDKLAFAGFSWGGVMGTMLPAVEPRIKANVLYVAGMVFQRSLPEVDQINYVPRVTVPTLMINGELDFFFPLETSQKPLYDLLGAPPEHKRYVVYPGSHSAPWAAVGKETLDWLDRYLGKVR